MGGSEGIEGGGVVGETPVEESCAELIRDTRGLI